MAATRVADVAAQRLNQIAFIGSLWQPLANAAAVRWGHQPL